VHPILFKGHHKICIAYPIYIFSFKSMKEGHDPEDEGVEDEKLRIMINKKWAKWKRSDEGKGNKA